MMFFAGFLVGFLVAHTFFIAALYLITSKGVNTKEYRQKLQTIVNSIENRHKEPVTIIRSTTEAERAMDHVKNLHSDRGGIPNNELR